MLVCLQKVPHEPLHKASKLHVTIKTAFKLALSTAKRYDEIHALVMAANHLKFNQWWFSVIDSANWVFGKESASAH